MPDALGPSSDQRRFFHEQGYLRLEQALTPARLRPVQKRILADLRQRGISPAGAGLPKTIHKLPAFQQIAKLSQLVEIPDLEAQVISPHLRKIVESLAMARVTSSQSQFLISPPKQEPGRTDGLNWHTDVSPREARIPGIQVFVIINDVEPDGGATLILSGSHRHTSDPQVNSHIREALRGGIDGAAKLHGLNLSVVELVGKSGDVYLMDMRVLHSPSINTRATLRVVATVRYFLE